MTDLRTQNINERLRNIEQNNLLCEFIKQKKRNYPHFNNKNYDQNIEGGCCM